MQQVVNPPSLYYRPITTPISPADFELLRAMRVASGWYYDRIPQWINEIATGQRLMWFIYLSDPMDQALAAAAATAGPALSASSYMTHHQPAYTTNIHYLNPSTSATSPYPYASPNTSYTTPASAFSGTASTTMNTTYPYPPVGMVCLSLSNPHDPTLASFSQTGRCEICSLFVYGAYRNLGVGVAAMRNMEERARMMGALYVTLNTPAVERPLRKYLSMGYREYKARSRVYSSSDVRNAGLPEEYETAAFLEKSLL
jgi:ribosomal protein S18 acetylase RimI-like enzyme